MSASQAMLDLPCRSPRLSSSLNQLNDLIWTDEAGEPQSLRRHAGTAYPAPGAFSLVTLAAIARLHVLLSASRIPARMAWCMRMSGWGSAAGTPPSAGLAVE